MTKQHQRKTIIIAGPCAVEYIKHPKISNNLEIVARALTQIRDITEHYEIEFMLRGGAFKPRTSYLNGSETERVFEGLEKQGLSILNAVKRKYNLKIVSEIMSETDILSFVKANIDVFQIGARTNQAYALLKHVGETAGSTGRGVMVKNAVFGHNPKEAKGSLERITNPYVESEDEPIASPIMYCIRGQSRANPINDVDAKIISEIQERLYQEDSNQHQDYRNLNNIDVINQIRNDEGENGLVFYKSHGIKFIFDPSHTIGGKTEQARRDIGKYAVKAITEYGYDGIMIEVNNYGAQAKCDREQALLTTLNRVQWGNTQYGEMPKVKPLSLVDIIREIMRFKAPIIGIGEEQLKKDLERLQKIMYE